EVASAVAPSPSFRRPRRAIEKPPQHGEKPFARLVEESFEGHTLRLSRRMRLLEEADTRKIRRGDALDLIDMVQRDLNTLHRVTPQSTPGKFARKYFAFAAGYLALAMAWCALMALQ